jgi:O-antigen/teichoic acid export membrane protein
VATAFAGLGAFSLAAAVPVGALAAALTAYSLQPWHFGVNLRREVIRPLIRFGAQTSLIGPAHFAREFGIVGLLTAVGGQSLAGFYAMAQRLFIIPTLITSTVWKVSVAALSRTAHDERDRLSAGGIAITTVAAGLPLALITGAAEPLISLLFGDRWLSSADVVAAGAPGLLLSSAAALLTGAALADGNARAPLLAAVAGGAVAVGLTAPLADALGAEGGGIASSAGFAVAALLLTVRAPAPQRTAMGSALKALAAMAIGALAGRAAVGGTGLEDLALALACSGGAWLAVTAILSRNELIELVRQLRRHAFRRVARRPAAEEPLAEAIAEAESAGF